MTKRNFLKNILLILSSIVVLKNFKFEKDLFNKIVLKRKYSKVWFFDINDLS